MYKKNERILSMCTVASVLLTSSLVTTKVSAANPPENPRLWGADRYETALKISQEGWTTSEYAVVASGEVYADALSAAPLAKVKNAPILLVQKDSISEGSLKELKRLGVTHVYIAGGEGAISKEVENKIKTVVTTIERLEGKDRYETSVKIAEKLEKVDKAIIASGEGYADALSAAPVAAIKGIPVLLTKVKELPSSTKEYLKSAGVTSTFVIGGVAAVSDGVVKVLPEAKRVAGKDRFETNAEVLRAFATDFDFANAYMALGIGPKGNEFADALAGAALSAKSEAPVILTGKTLNEATKVVAKEKLSPTSNITILGGAANISDALVNSIKITADALDKEGTEYHKDYAGNAVITGKNITFKDSTVKGNLYVEGNNATLTNLKVEGTVYVNPGKDGEALLDGIEAKDIVVLSGAKDTIRLKNVKANNLSIISRMVARLLVEGGTEIKATSVLSNIILEGKGGSFGEVTIPKTVGEKAVELRGNIDKPIVVEGNVELKAAAGATLAKVEIKSQATEKVVLGGNLGTVEVHTAANIKMTEGAKATIKATTEEAKASAKVEIPAGSSVTTEGISKDNVVGTPTTPPATGGGGGGSTTPSKKDYYTVVAKGAIPYTLYNGLDATIADAYDSAVSNSSLAINAGIRLALEKINKYNVEATGSLTDYIVSRLTDNGKSSALADALLSANKEAELHDYIKGKKFNDIYNILTTKFGGNILIPTGMKNVATDGSLGSIFIGKSSTDGISFVPGETLSIADVETALGITKDAKLSDLYSKTIYVKVENSDDDVVFKLETSKDDNGNTVVTSEMDGKTYTLTLSKETR